MTNPELAKKRVLPSWMTVEVTEGQKPLAAVRPKRRKNTPVARMLVYCMNEAELVDTALGLLAEKHDYKDAEENISSEGELESPLAPDDPPGSPASSSGASAHGTNPKPHREAHALGCGDRTDLEGNNDDDILKYVREIFFT